MKILITSTAVPGHLNPLLAIATILKKHNHEVVVQVSPKLKPLVDAAGISFLAHLPEVDLKMESFFAAFPTRLALPAGMEMFLFDVQHLFAASIPAQADGLELALRDFPADLILADCFFWGTLPILLGPRGKRPAIAHLGITVLNLHSGKNMPAIPGVTLEQRQIQQEARERLLLKPAQIAVNDVLAKIGCGPLPCPVLESMSVLPDIYIHPGIRSFEYPDESSSASSVHYIGPLPLPPGQIGLPDWWHELDKTKRLVLVTQGTIANHDFGQLIAPTLVALAKEEDVIILATTGNRPIESIGVDIPANARIAEYLPFELILPRIDLLITNGGYGTVNMALAAGVPMVCAGLSEDKQQVSEHVEWAGAGIDLKTSEPIAESLRTAAREVLDNPIYGTRAKEFAREFKSHDTEAELLRLIEACVGQTVEV